MPDIELNDAWFDSILRSPRVEALCKSTADRVLADARSRAPVDTGEYRDSLKVVRVRHAHRDTYEVGSDSGHALLVEARTGNLARSLRGARR